MEQKKFFIETFGCQMNHHDSEKVAGTLIKMGYAPTEDSSEAELALLNTCNIQEKANQKVFLDLVRSKNPMEPRPVLKLACSAAWPKWKERRFSREHPT